MEQGLSEQISAFVALSETIKEQYALHQKEVQRCELLTQDLLHKLELETNTYHERAAIATKLQQCREQRRPHKDAIAVMAPLATYLASGKGQSMLAQLEHIAKATQKAEAGMVNRKYSPRILSPGEYHSKAAGEASAADKRKDK